ncbi:hypothetical protein B0A48_00499 [Cryoendolithus antarcticus]|uniref:Uncharacterized protein n=1 Tax=Cryoendolithus antarcticus TaxID=1507870 RepID=A0A1V8TUU7_9PEZI|nr:hypothetical protein B0A48_00499 [Cryoendolithus antarcticus]
MIRLSRAICRHEAFCALMPSACQSTIWNADAARNVFLRIFPTWEIEEIACIYESLQYEYGCMLIEIAKHFCSLHPTADVNGWKKEEGYFDAFEPFDIRPGCDCFDRGRETLASLGPSRLYEMHRTRCLKFISDAHEDGFDHDHEWRLTPGYLLPGLLHDTYDDDTSLHHIFPAEEHVLLERCSTEQHVKHKQPSTGWLWLQLDDERTLADARRRYAETTPLGHFDMRYWGYVFWDEERMQATGLPSEYAPFVLNSIFDWDKWRTNEEDAWTRMKAAPISDHWDFVVFTKRVVQSSQFLTADRD